MTHHQHSTIVQQIMLAAVRVCVCVCSLGKDVCHCFRGGLEAGSCPVWFLLSHQARRDRQATGSHPVSYQPRVVFGGSGTYLIF